MVEQSPVNTSDTEAKAVTTTIDGQDMTCVPTKAAAAVPVEAAAPVVAAAGSEETLPPALNEIAPAAGLVASPPPATAAEVCEVPGRQTASAEQLASAILVSRPEAGQTKTYAALGENQTYNLTFDYSDALVERDGKNVVIRFADGAVVILEDFADKASSTRLIADNCEAAPLQFASLDSIAPAAGAAAAAAGPQANAAPGNTGAGFSPFDAGNLPGVPGPLGPLAPTSLNYRQIDGLRPEDSPPVDGKPGGLDLSSPLNVVDETGGGGTAGDFSNPRTTGGDITVDFGPDGAGDIRIIAGPSGITHHGDPVIIEISPDGLTATGKTGGGETVFVFTLDPAAGTYAFAQNGSLDHPIPGSPDEPLDLPFVIRVTDRNGDFVDGDAVIRVLDDAPSALAGEGSVGAVDESEAGSFSGGGFVGVDGAVDYSYGGDGAGSIRLVAGPEGLTSNGVPILVDVSADTVSGLANGNLVFILSLDPSTGEWSYRQFAPLDHPDAGNPDDLLSLGFTARVTDFDGDWVDTPITVSVADAGPAVDGNALAGIDETGGFDSVSGTLPVSFGQDGPAAVDPVRITVVPSGLTSGGVPVVVTIGPDGLTATGVAGGVTVFTLTITNPATGAYTFTQSAALDHPDAGDPDDVLNLGFGFTVKDSDGDTASGDLVVTVRDDAPTAGTATFSSDELGVAQTGTLPHGYGQDGPGSLVMTDALLGLTSEGRTVNVAVTTGGVTGTLDDGTLVFSFSLTGPDYSFTQYLDLDDNPVLSFGYNVADSDGDIARGTVEISTRPDGKPSADPVEVTIDETDGLDAIDGMLPYTFGPDGPAATDPVRITGVPSGLVSDGLPVVVTVSADGLTATGVAGGVTVFTLVINDPLTGSATFRQLAPLDHPDAGNPDDALSLNFTLRVTDSDGDGTDAPVTVRILDDGPSLSGVHRIALDETNATDTVGVRNDGIWATATSGTPLSASGTMTHSFGRDGAGALTLTSAPATLKHHGESVQVTISGNVATGTLADGTLVFTLSLNGATGEYVLKQYASLDHPDSSDFNEILQLSFGVRITDSDGDSASALLTLKVRDDGPVAGDDGFSVDQGKIKDDGNPNTPLFTNTGKLDFSYGDDGKGSLALTSKPSGLFSDGQAVLVAMAGNVITGKLASGQTVFTLEVAQDGTYTYRQYAEIDSGSSSGTAMKFGYAVIDADKDCDAGTLSICIKGDLQQPQPPHIAVSVETETHVRTETLSFEHEFSETRTWQGKPKEAVPSDPALRGIDNDDLIIGGNYVLPPGLVDTPLHHVSVTFTGQGAGYNNALGWCIVGDDGTISDVRLGIANINSTPTGTTVSLGDVAAGTRVEFFIIPNGAGLNGGFTGLPAGGHFEFWTGGAPGAPGSSRLNANDASNAGFKLYYVVGSDFTEIKTAQGMIYFASHDNLNRDGQEHIIAGVATGEPNALNLGFEDLKNAGDFDYNDLLFKVTVSPAQGTIETKTLCSDLSALVTDPDSAKLSAALVKLSGVSGDTLDLGSGYTLSGANILHNGVDTGVDFTRQADGGFKLAGAATLAVYQSILDGVELHASTNPDGLRTATFQITDDTGLASNQAAVTLYPSCSGSDSLLYSVKDFDPAQRDVHVFDQSKGCETIVGFNKHEGDCIDLKQVLSDHCASREDIGNFVRIESHDGNTVIKVDETGSGAHFKDAAVLVGVTGCSLDSMLADGSLEVGRFQHS